MEKANIAYQYRIYPTSCQRELIAKTFGCCRKVYNLMLSDKIRLYQETGKNQTVTPARYKKEYPFLKEVDSLALANEQLHLQTAFRNFFRDKRIGFPKYKSRRRDRASYTTNCVNGNIVISEKTIRLPKLGRVKIRLHRQAPKDYRLKSVTLSESADETYTVSVLYEYEAKTQAVSGTTHIGLDYKSDGLYVDSNGECCDMPHFFRRSQKSLARAQRRLSRKQGSRKGETESANHRKQRIRAAKIARHTANQRKDFLHKKSAEITNLYDVISVEGLNMKGMSRTLHLGKATMDNGYGMFVSMLEYKQKRKGHQLIRVGRYFPSSQLCQCGYKNPAAKDLKVRTITCPACGKTYDRDENAAVNIDKEGYRMVMSA